MNLGFSFFDLLDYNAPDETFKLGAASLDDTLFDAVALGYEGEGTPDGEVGNEVYKNGVKNLNMRLFTGEEP